jgi:hypothetical protein
MGASEAFRRYRAEWALGMVPYNRLMREGQDAPHEGARGSIFAAYANVTEPVREGTTRAALHRLGRTVALLDRRAVTHERIVRGRTSGFRIKRGAPRLCYRGAITLQLAVKQL